ncbi:MAG TPA: GlsB/YeaQ/YmgE family stress response membrane protein [Rhodocyclaceae bacterium]|nr:GlsB/YeaQ/YmgE family stress response membrane protein [Rhodocyclaceae bacterium]HNB79309.1 GlsB/YeaQ/YmgE family stress response membrane protein [Rhodocyclaceae bacterium]
MGVIGTIVIGFIVGVLAKLLHPGKENMGFIMTTVLGIAGSVVASYVGQALGLYTAGEGAGFIGAVVGAIALLVVYGLVKGKSGQA